MDTIFHGRDTAKSIRIKWLIALFIILVKIPAGAQEFQFLPDAFHKINYSKDIITVPPYPSGGSSNTYNDPLEFTAHDLWSDMQANPGTWNTKYTFKSITNLVKVGVNHDTALIVNNYKYRIVIEVTGYANPATPNTGETKQISLVLEYNKDSLQIYKDQTAYKIDGAYHAMSAKIVGIYDISVSPEVEVERTDLAKNFFVETSVIVQRYDKEEQQFFINSGYNASSKELEVSWRHYNPASVGLSCSFYSTFTDQYKPAKYELEWVYIDDYSFNVATQTKGYLYSPSSFSIPYNFRNNATRVQTNESRFSIPVVYEHGVILFRVRTIRPDPNNYRKMIYSDWDLPESGTISNSTFGGFGQTTPFLCQSQCIYFINTSFSDDKFNWQYSINFAEEGKYKHVLNYFDGAGHGRQTQTRINTDANYIVAADKIYDFEGRPSIQTLPVPVLSPNLDYKPNLSLKQSGSPAPYKADDFDFGCTSDSIAPFDPSSLAGTYYSTANPDQAGMQQFVPDAKGYPFMETIYAPDNTNKVIWQGGAGIDFQRFRDHGTRNTYVRAEQFELNRLMGTESGRFEYYPKQIVTDPNKQSSYTIFNPDGKVIATALMGAAPSDTAAPIVPLENIAQPQSVTMNLLANLTQQVGDGLRLAQHSFFPEAGGMHQFQYKGKVTPYSPGCSNQYINVQGLYSVKVIDECGNIKKEQNGIAGVSSITSSSAAQPFSGNEETFTLPAEKHTLVKELYFPDTAITRLASAFTDLHTGINDCYVYQDSFIRRTVDAATFPCKAGDTSNACDILKRQMMDELYPGAKYGGYTKTPDGKFQAGTANSIFTLVNANGEPLDPSLSADTCMYIRECYENTANPPPGGTENLEYYDYPWASIDTFYLPHSDTYPYGVPLGNTGVTCYARGPYNCISPNDVYKMRYQWNCANNMPQASIPVGPGQAILGTAAMYNGDQLIANFNDAIAEALLPLHPEYCKLLLCNDDLDKRLAYVESYDEAQALGVHTLSGLLANDPLSQVNNPSAPLTANQLSFYAIDNTITGSNSSLLRRLDTFSLEQAYCGCDGPAAYSYCRNKEYVSQINQMQLIDGEIKDLFIKKLIDNYLGNRNLLKQRMFDGAANTCGPCAALRMDLEPEAVFSSIFDGASNNMSYDPSLPSWAWDIMQDGMNGSQFNNTIPSEVQQQFDDQKEDQCKAQVKAIMDALASCGLSPQDSTNLSLDLIAAGCTAGSGGGRITPDMVKAELIANSIPLSDLCSPFLAEYGLYDGAQQKAISKYANKKASFYIGLQQFLNRTEILTALHDAASSTSQTLTIGTTNTFEAELGQVLNLPSGGSITATAYLSSIAEAGTSTAAQQYIRLALVNGSYRDTLYFSTRRLNATNYCANPLLPQPAPMDGAVGNLVFDNLHSVLNDPIAPSSQEGYIADNLVFADFRIMMPGGSSTIYACSPYNIWSHTLPMLKARDPEALDDCIHCVQIKEAVAGYFADAANYALPLYVNHPLFGPALSNYLNYKLQKSHTFEEYERLMQGCALSDKINFKRSMSTFNVDFGNLVPYGHNFMANLKTTFPDVNIDQILYYIPGVTVGITADLNTVPRSQLQAVKQYIQSYNGGNFSSIYNPELPGGHIAWVFMKSGSPCNFSGISIPNATLNVSTAIAGFEDINNGVAEDHILYKISCSSSSPLDVANATQAVKDYLATNNCNASWTVYAYELYRSSDYSNTVKKDYLSYVYGLSSLATDAINEAIAPAPLQSNAGISAITGAALVSYRDPWCSNVKEDLYYSAAPTASDAGWNKLGTILDRVKLALGGNFLFPTATTTVSPGALGSGGTSLKAYKMTSGWAWYRLFDQQNKLYNTYLAPSPKMVGEASSYQMVPGSLTAVLSADSIYRFKVQLQKTLSGGTHTVTCYGYTDFALAPAQKLQHVVLHDHKNAPGCIDTFTCEREVLAGAIQQGKMLHARYIDSIKRHHYAKMREHFPQNTLDTLPFTTQKQQYQYTLYYYDLAGNLTRTVPPAGVDTLAYWDAALVDGSRVSNIAYPTPAHQKVSYYKYNSFNQLIWQQTPDAGITEFFYDAAGRLCFSQNANQKPLRRYSYTLYDDQGRIIETGAIGFAAGEIPGVGSHPVIVRDAQTTTMASIVALVSARPREDVVATFYDNQLLLLASNPGMSAQENLRKRVSSILYAPMLAQGQTPESYYTYGSHFSYDALGNVSTLVQDNPYLDYMDQRFKRIDYDYDLLSGKVNMVSYNRGRADQFYQKYTYDADNRITLARSSKDGLIWDRDAAYTYYKHGPLAQVQIGDLNVQSLQYAYTIQGWLKAINGDILRPEDDMGKDGLNGGLYPGDVFAHALDYHKGDYKPIGNTPVTYTDGTDPMTRSLYNGNIARQATGIRGMDNLQRNYEYDQLNRLKKTEYQKVNNDLTHAVTNMANAYRNSYRYDRDGNIRTLTRRNEAGTYIDSLTYHYANAANNKLGYVSDAAANSGGTDLPTGQAANNYQYDNIGNLVKDEQGNIGNIHWNLYGKVKDMEMTGDNIHIHYDYDGSGNRVRKDVFTVANNDTLRLSDIYVRDASGNIMAMYKEKTNLTGGLTIEWLNDDINNEHGSWQTPSGTGIAPFLVSEYGNNGQFTTSLFQYGIGNNAGWSNAQSASLSLGQYLTLSNSIYSQAVHEPVAEYFQPAAQAQPTIWTTTFKSDRNNVFLPLLQALAEDADTAISRKTFLHMATAVPPLALAIINDLNIKGVKSTPADRAQALYTYVVSQGSTALVASYYDRVRSINPHLFYQALIADGNIIDSAWLSSREGLGTYLTDKLEQYAPKDNCVIFFQNWLVQHKPNWLDQHSTLEERLGVVYNYNRSGFLVSFLDNIGMTGVNTSLHRIPQLSVSSYLGSIQQAVLTGTLNPTYDPPDVNTPDPENIVADTLYLAEHHLYGSSRLGIKTYGASEYANIFGEVPGELGGGGTSPTPVLGVADSSLSRKRPWFSYGFADWIKKDKADEYSGSAYNLSLDSFREVRSLGRKQYEMSDHLGNVLAAVMDRKSGYGNTNGLYNGFYANLASVSDYYPGGFGIRERMKELENYRFGNQEQESDDEIYGDKVAYAYKYRMQDTRLNRFWSVDPLYKQYPYNSSYAFSENRLIDGFELEGAEYVRGSKFEYDGSGWDYLKAVPNAMTDIGNGLFDIIWNDWVYSAKAVKNGTYVQGLKEEVKAVPGNVKNYVVNSYRYTVNTPFTQQLKDAVSPQAVEGMLAFVGTVATTKKLPSVEIGFAKRATPRLNVATKPVSKLVGFGDDAAILENTANLTPKRGWFDVVVHGTEDGLGFTMNGNFLSPQQLYSNMLTNGYQQGQKIRLLSCYSGSLVDGAAFQLSNLAKAPVVAPTSSMWIANGKGFLPAGRLMVDNGGWFKLFKETKK